MTKDDLRPLLKRAYDAGRADVLRERTATFADESEDSPRFAPAFSAADVDRLGDYFAADERGHYPNALHRHFGMRPREFADAAGMLRKQVIGPDGRAAWVWARRAPVVPPPAPEAVAFSAGYLDGEHHGRTEGGEEWFSEQAYALFADGARGDLVPKKIQVTRNGKAFETTVYVRPGTAAGADDHQKRAGAAGSTPVALDRAIRDPASLTADQIKSIAADLKDMPKEQLRQLAVAFGQKIGGRNADLAKRLIEHLQSNRVGADTTGPAPAPKPTPVNYPANPEAAALAGRFIAASGAQSKVAAEYYSRENAKIDAIGAADRAVRAYEKAVASKRTEKYQQKLKAEADRLLDEATRLEKLAAEANEAREKLRGAAHQKLAELLAPKERAKLNANLGPMYNETQRKLVADAHAFVESVVCNWSGDRRYATAEASKGRAFYSDDNLPHSIPAIATGEHFKHANVSEHNAQRALETQVHEIGHMIENRKPGVRELATEFLKRRVGDEEPKSLKELFPDSKYDPWEKGRKDNFDRVLHGSHAYYAGKSYSSGDTEVVSMGLEQLYRDPVRFAEKDPDYFAFMIHVLKS